MGVGNGNNRLRHNMNECLCQNPPKVKNDTTTVISASHPKLRKATIRYREATVGEPGPVKDAWSTDNNKNGKIKSEKINNNEEFDPGSG